jgi:choline kinase
MKAILLAAGVGERLKPFTDNHPKCLAQVGDRTLLDRHLDILSELEVIDGCTIVVGYRQDQIRDAVTLWQDEQESFFEVDFLVNEKYERGSILSLQKARRVMLDHDTIVMDADVLYHPQVMERLLDSEHANCFLLDEGAEQSGEEMIVCVRQGRALHIARSHDPSTQTGWDLRGEGVGFFRLSRKSAPALVEILDGTIAGGLEGLEYEVALARFMKDNPCGCERVGDLPWTEIDFPMDLERANQEILPQLK